MSKTNMITNTEKVPLENFISDDSLYTSSLFGAYVSIDNKKLNIYLQLPMTKTDYENLIKALHKKYDEQIHSLEIYQNPIDCDEDTWFAKGDKLIKLRNRPQYIKERLLGKFEGKNTEENDYNKIKLQIKTVEVEDVSKKNSADLKEELMKELAKPKKNVAQFDNQQKIKSFKINKDDKQQVKQRKVEMLAEKIYNTVFKNYQLALNNVTTHIELEEQQVVDDKKTEQPVLIENEQTDKDDKDDKGEEMTTNSVAKNYLEKMEDLEKVIYNGLISINSALTGKFYVDTIEIKESDAVVNIIANSEEITKSLESILDDKLKMNLLSAIQSKLNNVKDEEDNVKSVTVITSVNEDINERIEDDNNVNKSDESQNDDNNNDNSINKSDTDENVKNESDNSVNKSDEMKNEILDNVEKIFIEQSRFKEEDWVLNYSTQFSTNSLHEMKLLIHIDNTVDFKINNLQKIKDLITKYATTNKLKLKFRMTLRSLDDDTNSFVKHSVQIEKSNIVSHSVNDTEDSKMIFGEGIDSELPVISNVSDFLIERLGERACFDVQYFSSRDGATSFKSRNGNRFNKFDFVAVDKGGNAFTFKMFTKFDKDKEKDGLYALNSLKKGDEILITGKSEWDKYMKESIINLDSIKLIKHEEKIDNSNKDGRYELHTHTKMSQMGAVANSKELIEKAAKIGLGGIAFTDESSIQSFSTLIDSQNKYKSLKPVFGAEFNTITDTPTFVHNPNDLDLFSLENTKFVAFDTETTGLSSINDTLIELSAAKFEYQLVDVKKNRKVVGQEQKITKTDEFTRIINPHRKLDKTIIDLTSIQQVDVDNGSELVDAVNDFVDFVGGDKTILIGQNVSFDLGFLNHIMSTNDDIKIDRINNETIDTLTLARRTLQNKRSYKLSKLADMLKIKLVQAHRAINDAIATGYVGAELLKLYNEEVNHINNGIELQSYAKNEEHAYQEGFSNTISVLVKNQKGVKNLYRMISVAHTKHYYRKPLLYPIDVIENRENLFIGSGGKNSKMWDEAYRNGYDAALEVFNTYNFDYLEILPLGGYQTDDSDETKKRYRDSIDIYRKIAKLKNIPIIAISDAHYVDDKDKRIYEILVSPKVQSDVVDLKLMTTEELINEFSKYIDDKDEVKKIVVDNTLLIGNQIEYDIQPIVTALNPPIIENSDKQIEEETMANARKMYGEKLPTVVEERLKTELGFIVDHGYAVHYITAQKMVEYSNSLGYIVGSRGSVGSSAVAFMLGITEVNALPPHYRSTHDDYVEFVDPKKYKDGYDLPMKEDPNHPGEQLIRDGHNLQFSTFMGLSGTKIPDIDLNAASDVQGKMQLKLREMFGQDHTIRVGTISGLATASSKKYVIDYSESRNLDYSRTQVLYLAERLEGVKKTTGQHPAGIMIVPKNKEILDFTPYNYPANKSDALWMTTHFIKEDMHDALLKMDVLGHDDPMMLHFLQGATGVDVTKIDAADPKVISIFNSTKELHTKSSLEPLVNSGVLGIPEFNTQFAMGILKTAKPKTFADLVQISGLSHGSDVWEGNAKDLLDKGITDLAGVIGSRDKLMNDVLQYGMPLEFADKIVQYVKKGFPIPEKMVNQMTGKGVPKWYIESAGKIGYMYPAAHAIAYVTSAMRIAYFKVYYPAQFYAAVLTYRYSEFDIHAISSNSQKEIRKAIKVIEEDKDLDRVKKAAKVVPLQIIDEAMARGIEFEKPSIKYSEVNEWTVNKENGKIVIPLGAIDGVGIGAAKKIVDYRDKNDGSFSSNLSTMKKEVGINITAVRSLEEAKLIEILNPDDKVSEQQYTIM